MRRQPDVPAEMAAFRNIGHVYSCFSGSPQQMLPGHGANSTTAII